MRLFKKTDKRLEMLIETGWQLFFLREDINNKLDREIEHLNERVDCVNRRIDGDEMFFNEMIRTHVDMMHKTPKKPVGKEKP